MKWFILSFSSGFGLGYLPIAPGTWGSLLGIPLAYFLNTLNKPIALITLVAFIAFSIWTANEAEKIYQQKDASRIVIDEVAGMAVTLLWLPLNVQTIVAAFLLFRVLDILKVFPANWIEKKCAGGVGIVMDDVVLGVMARLILALVFRVGWL